MVNSALMIEKLGLWTRTFVLAIVLYFLVFTVHYMMITSVALYAVGRFSASDSGAGLAAGIFVLGALVSRPIAGALLERVGRRRMIIASVVTFAVASVCYLAIDSFATLLVVRCAQGMAFGAASTSVTATVQGLIPASRRGEGTGYFTSGGPLAAAVGPFVALLLVDAVGYNALFVVSGIVAMLGVLAALMMRSPDATGQRRRARIGPVVHLPTVPVGLMMLMMGLAYSAVLVFLQPFASSLGMSTAGSLFFLAYASVLLCTRVAAGRFQDRWGDSVVIYPSSMSFAAGLLLLSQASATWMILVSGGLIGLGFGTLMASSQAIAARHVAREQMGAAMSTFFVLLEVGTGLGPVLFGSLVSFADYRAAYVVAAAAVVVAAGAFALGQGASRRPLLARANRYQEG